jgi:predicted nucleic acid-binding protein
MYHMGANMRIYLDNCSLNRPFDDQSQTRIKIETEAKLALQAQVRSGEIELVWSYIIDYENSFNPLAERRRLIAQWKRYAWTSITASPRIVENALAIKRAGFGPKDALHLACAIAGKSDYFVTTDDAMLHKAAKIRELKIVDPSHVVRELNI